jgi:hypothetical protein
MPDFHDQNRFGAMQAATQTMMSTSDAVGRFLRDSASAARDIRRSAWQRCAAARLAVAPTPAPIATAGPQDHVDSTVSGPAAPRVTVLAR